MKTHPLSLCRAFNSAAPAAVLSLALALMPAAHAKDKGHGGNGHASNGHGNSGKHEPAAPKHDPKFDKHEPKFDKKFEKKLVTKFVPKVHPREDRARVVYMSHPRSAFVLSPGIGYAGRGYYYGPPNSPYYYQHPDVKYFARREDFPNGYVLQPGYQPASDEIAVQQALSRLGYYQGPIDGRIGPQTLSAIAQYEQDHNMSISNAIVPALLQALGLQ